MPKIDRDGAGIDDEVHGSGPPLLLTRGFGSTSAMWRDRIAPLSTHHKPVLWNMRGHGRSDYPRDPAAYNEAFIDAVLPFLHDLDAKPAQKVAS
jgi:pimeloyl-ACP methyl ester carboxylesterase